MQDRLPRDWVVSWSMMEWFISTCPALRKALCLPSRVNITHPVYTYWLIVQGSSKSWWHPPIHTQSNPTSSHWRDIFLLTFSNSLNKTVCVTVNFKENTLLWHEKRHQSTRFILIWKKFENLLDSMWTSYSTWEWEDAIGSLSIAQSEKTPTKKRGGGRRRGEKKSHNLGNHITLWIIYQETLKKKTFVSTVALSL